MSMALAEFSRRDTDVLDECPPQRIGVGEAAFGGDLLGRIVAA